MLAGSDVTALVGDSVGVLVGGAGVDTTGGNGVDVEDSTSVGVGVEVGVGDCILVGAGVGAAQASKHVANSNVRRINISGIMVFRFTSVPLFALNLSYDHKL